MARPTAVSDLILLYEHPSPGQRSVELLPTEVAEISAYIKRMEEFCREAKALLNNVASNYTREHMVTLHIPASEVARARNWATAIEKELL